MQPPRIGERLFLDGVTRDVFVGDDRREYVLDHEGNPIHGIWIYIPAPDPVIIKSDDN